MMNQYKIGPLTNQLSTNGDRRGGTNLRTHKKKLNPGDKWIPDRRTAASRCFRARPKLKFYLSVQYQLAFVTPINLHLLLSPLAGHITHHTLQFLSAGICWKAGDVLQKPRFCVSQENAAGINLFSFINRLTWKSFEVSNCLRRARSVAVAMELVQVFRSARERNKKIGSQSAQGWELATCALFWCAGT